MKIQGMRWGYDGGGIACGPVSGSSIVEVEFSDAQGHTLYGLSSVMDNFELITISEKSLFDLMMSADFDEETVRAASLELLEAEIDEEFDGSQFRKSVYWPEISFVRHAMQAYMDMGGEPGEKEAAEYIQPYLGHEPSEYRFPLATYGILDDEDDDEEEF